MNTRAPVSDEDVLNVLDELTKPGGQFPVSVRQIRGAPYRVFDTAPANLLAYYQFGAALHPDKTFIVYEDTRWTFQETMDNAARLANALSDKLGVKKGDRVALAMRNYPEWVTSFMAVTALGAVIVPVNSWWTAEELDYGLEDCGATVLIADSQRAERAAGTVHRLGIKLIVARPEGALPHGAFAYDHFIADVADTTFPEVEVGPEDDATIFYTSGSTGHPKGAVSTHRGVISTLMLWMVFTVARLTAEGTYGQESDTQTAALMTVPLFHVTGSHSIFLMSFLIGRKLVLMYKWDVEEALKIIEKERITNFTGVPTMSWELLNAQNADKYDLSSLQDIGAGGAARPAGHVKLLKDRFPHANPGSGYGLTETNAAGAVNVGASYLEKPGSTGKPTPPLVEMKIVDENDRELPAGERGEILIRCPGNVRGYWNKPEETAAAFLPDGFFRSGDIGYLDEDGYLFIVDRAKDIVIRGGENISCLEVEAVLYQHPDVFETTVFGVPDERLGETLACVIVPRQGHTIDPEELRAHVGDHLASFKVPEKIFFRNEQLPRTASGKIYKREIKSQTLEGLERSTD